MVVQFLLQHNIYSSNNSYLCIYQDNTSNLAIAHRRSQAPTHTHCMPTDLLDVIFLAVRLVVLNEAGAVFVQ